MEEMTYRKRMELLREKKIAHTIAKREQQGFMDVDDYGTIPVPDSFTFSPVLTDSRGGIYGAAACAANFAALLDAHPVYADPLEILCGRWCKMLTEYRAAAGTWDEDKYPYTQLKPSQQQYGIISGIGSDTHCAPDFAIGLSLGFGGLLSKIEKFRAVNPGKNVFYDAERDCLLAIQRMISRHIAELERLALLEDRPEMQRTLAMSLAANRNILAGAPGTFLEACQWISWYNVATRIYDRDGAGCRLDILLQPYYDRDTATGILHDDLAVFILANLLLIETHYYQLSGVDVNDCDQTCKLSWLILDAAHWLNGPANLTVRIHPNISEDYLLYAVRYLFTDRNGWPRFCGDDGLVKGYMRNGADKAVARSRIAVGCNWMAVPGAEFPMHDCVKINIARVFEVAFHEMMSGSVRSTELLEALFVRHLQLAINTVAEGINFHLAHQHEMMPELMLNLMMYDTIEKGLDITQCPRLGTIGVDGAGLATVADSFAALEQRIEREKRVSWEEVNHALQSDFAGVPGERIRLMLSTSERFCQGHSLGDRWARRITEQFSRLVHDMPMPYGRRLVPGWFSWSNTIMLGKMVGATPDGRHAFAPITHGANPNPGFRKDGAATAQARGIALVQPGYGAAAPLQLEFDPGMTLEEGGAERVLSILKAHCRMGGTLININVLDAETLMKANANPDLYPDLVVRVTGFTAYFAALSPQFRKLVVDRFLEGF
jgi:pyruvate-formate lyase